MPRIKKIFLSNTSNPLFWITLGFIFKGIPFLFVILNHPYQDVPGIWGATQADDSSYLNPIDNLLAHGVYSPDFRMPGYGAFYLLFRFILTPPAACNALIVLQVILASLSVYYLALTAKNIFKSDTLFYITFYLFILCPYSNFFDAYIASESLCASLLIFGVYFFTRYFKENKTNYLLFAGLLLTWVMFIRPVFGGVLVICCVLIIFQKQTVLNIKTKQVFLFLIPFLLFEGLWIARNYEAHKKLIPFTTTGAFYPNAANSYLEPLFEFAQSWGGACSITQKTVDLDWFHYYYPGMPPIPHYDSLPDNIYTSAFNKDSLLRLKGMIIALQKPAIDSNTIVLYQHQLRLKLNAYQQSEKREKPIQYFILAPLKMMGVMLAGPVTRDYLNRGQSVPFIGKLIIVFDYFIYTLIILTGLAGIILLIFKNNKQNKLLLIISAIPLYTLLVHPFLFRFFDSRFLLPTFPFMIVCGAYVISKSCKQSFGK